MDPLGTYGSAYCEGEESVPLPRINRASGNDVLSDAGLVKWWKAVMDDFVSACTKNEKDSSGGQLRVEPHVTLPGATDDEVMHLLKVPLQTPEATPGHHCRCGHPYSPPPSSTAFSLARFPLLS